jgi:two-component system OmpR family sensor kinase
VSARNDRGPLGKRLWESRWPEAAWATFAVGNLAWMIMEPAWSMLPYHFTWMSLLLLYGLGFRTWPNWLLWWLLIPVVTAIILLFVDPAIRGQRPYDELVEPPFMIALFCVLVLHANRREAAIATRDEVSRRNLELLERQRAFIQNASHQLRTPITIALAHAELLQQDCASPATASDAAIVVDELTRMRWLVDQLLLLATAEQGDALRSAAVPTRLATVANAAVRRWELTPREWLIGQSDDPTVLADPDRLMLALDAVIENAVEFTSDGDAIELSVCQRGDQEAAIVVADSGPGIPEGKIGSMFERFARSESTRTGPRSFGLGLSIVRAIAESHGGRVTAERCPLGGVAVAVWLPLYDTPEQAPAADETGDGQISPPVGGCQALR